MEGYGEPEPNMLDVDVSIPVDSTFAAAAELLDALTDRHTTVRATRQNPRVLAAMGGGDINPTDLVFWIGAALSARSLLAFGARFFEHVADDTYEILRRQIAEYRARPRKDMPERRVFLLVHRRDDEPGYLSFRWEPDDDLQRLSAAAMRLPEESKTVSTYYGWDDGTQQWVEYDIYEGFRPSKAKKPKR